MLFNTSTFISLIRPLNKKMWKLLLAFWGMRGQDYLLLIFTDLYNKHSDWGGMLVGVPIGVSVWGFVRGFVNGSAVRSVGGLLGGLWGCP